MSNKNHKNQCVSAILVEKTIDFFSMTKYEQLLEHHNYDVLKTIISLQVYNSFYNTTIRIF